MEFIVFVKENSDVDAEPREIGRFATREEALAVCQERVAASLEELLVPGLSAAKLFQAYTLWGEDVFLVGDRFSAWEYARQRAVVLCAAL